MKDKLRPWNNLLFPEIKRFHLAKEYIIDLEKAVLALCDDAKEVAKNSYSSDIWEDTWEADWAAEDPNGYQAWKAVIDLLQKNNAAIEKQRGGV